MKDDLDHPEFNAAADNLLNVCRIHLAKFGNKSPTAKELVEMAKKVLESRA